MNGIKGEVPVFGSSMHGQSGTAPTFTTYSRDEFVSWRGVVETALPRLGMHLAGRDATLLTGGTSVVEWSLHPVKSHKPRRLSIWINAFLPAILDKDILRVVPAGQYHGQTAIVGPIASINDLFLTDQRSFSLDATASSRLHSLIEVDFDSQAIVREIHGCSPTVELDDDGDVECGPARASTSGMHFKDSTFSGPTEYLTFETTLKAGASNRCWKGSFDIDYSGKVSAARRLTDNTVLVTYDMLIEPFPAFEMYASVNNGPPIALFRRLPKPGLTPMNLFLFPDVPMQGEETLIAYAE